MNLKNLTLIGAALLLSAPMFGATYYGGFEDYPKGDYDYNDLVFSLSGNGLTLNSTGKFYSQPVLDNSGNPFWNNLSWDVPAASYNVGFCIYGGGACNGGVALSPGAQFLADASSPSRPVNEVTFSVNGDVTAAVTLSITAAKSYLGYYLLSDGVNRDLGAPTNTFTFTPGGDFGLFGYNDITGLVHYSQASLQNTDTNLSHFAFFTPAPEPGMMGLVGAGLLGFGALLRRKKSV